MANKVEFKPFDKVLVRDCNEVKWEIDLFQEYEEFKSDLYYSCLASTWNQCIPYEGNEHLLGTTDNPEQHEQNKNSLFGIELKPGYVLKLKNGAAGVLFPIREKAYPYKQKLAIIYSHGAWVYLENADITEVASIHGYSHGFALESGEVLWQRSDVQKLTKAQISEKLGMNVQDFEIVE